MPLAGGGWPPAGRWNLARTVGTCPILCLVLAVALGLAVVGVVLAEPAAVARTWTSVGGARREAELVARDGNRVILQSGPQAWSIELAQLSVADREFVEHNTGAAVERIDQELVSRLEQIRSALAERRLTDASDLLQQVAPLGVSERQRQWILDARQTLQYLQRFWQAVETSWQSLERDAVLTLPQRPDGQRPDGEQTGRERPDSQQASDEDTRSAVPAMVVQRNGSRLVLQRGGRNYLFDLRQREGLPSSLVAALARRSLPPSSPGMACLNAFLQLDAQPPEAPLWEAAALNDGSLLPAE